MQQTISCVSREPLLKGSPSAGVSSLTFPARWIRLRGPRRLSLSVLHAYRVEQSGRVWAIRSAAYSYAVQGDDGRELVAYHWHPDVVAGDLPVSFPHLHVSGSGVLELRKGHLPTGRVSIESVVRYLIADLAVEPIRADWRRVMDRNEADVVARRSWA